MKHYPGSNEYHVSPEGSDAGDGSLNHPFRTISVAARAAQAGDTITVHAGIYREWVKPPRGGDSDIQRIVYRAAPGETVLIKGSEVINTWQQVSSKVWKVSLPNSFFGNYNPYQDQIFGDWFDAKGKIHHTGEVYLNGKSLYEVDHLTGVENPQPQPDALDGDSSLFTWYCESDQERTTIWANFGIKNPNTELVEINVRPCCFYPERTGINFITVRGFQMRQAATQWAPPTAEQIGAIGAHWSKGWIIENNLISDSKCSGISLGKDRASGHNFAALKRLKPGYQYQLEAVFKALQLGWSKDLVGSHIVRNNTIYNCEQAGIVGHLGCAFSQIYNNHIFNIWTKRQFTGAEIAGIKFHAPLDTLIRNNCIHDCRWGIWLDWQAQGTRVSGNLLFRNLKDLMIEVCHGPFVVDNNILLSSFGMDLYAQGGCFAHNLIGGSIKLNKVLNRSTPYHVPHSTAIAGTAVIFGGDDRYFNNIFCNPISGADHAPAIDNGETLIGKGSEAPTTGEHGLAGYNAHPPSYQAFFEQLEKGEADYKIGTVLAFANVQQPVWIGSNAYAPGCQPYQHESDNVRIHNPEAEIRMQEEGQKIFLSLRVDNALLRHPAKRVTSHRLGMTRISEAAFEDPTGSPISIDADYLGNQRPEHSPLPGPIEGLKEGSNTIQVWPVCQRNDDYIQRA